MKNTPAIGPSTIAAITLILGSAVAFVTTWAQGSPNIWLAAIAAGLSAVLSTVRSYQQVYTPQDAEQ